VEIEPNPVHNADSVSPQRAFCRSCGYALTEIDPERTDYRCPECGKINNPGDLKLSPITRPPWPGPVKLVAMFCWPGVLAAIGALGSDWGLRHVHSGDGLSPLVWNAMLAGFIVPVALSVSLSRNRVPEIARPAWRRNVAVAGIVVNTTLAAVGIYVRTLL